MTETDGKPLQIGLRVDVDTLNGTREGVPWLLDMFAKHHIQASIFFSVGPDNMGRHLWRLFKPAFLLKMLRSNAPGLYGWSILLQGTFWPGKKIGKLAEPQIRAAFDGGHEVGLHAWDHHRWQARLDRMTGAEIAQAIERGMAELTRITRHTENAPKVTCSAVAGWKCKDDVLVEKEGYQFIYNSDCRGDSIFMPVVNGQNLKTPQIPVTLPTYDEIIGNNGITDKNYNEYLLSLVRPGKLNVLTIHAEVEGVSRRALFEHFLDLAHAQGKCFTPLGCLLPENQQELPQYAIESKALPGREGTLCRQGQQILDTRSAT